MQESFYNKIVARYMQFCTQHSKDLDSAFASLSLEESKLSTIPPPRRQSVRSAAPQPARAPSPLQPDLTAPATGQANNDPVPVPSAELSTILQALRTLREGLLAISGS